MSISAARGGSQAKAEAAGCYETLQLHPAAPLDLIAAAYWTLVDRIRSGAGCDHQGDLALHRLTQAYLTLANPTSRAIYDASIGFKERSLPPLLPSPAPRSWLSNIFGNRCASATAAVAEPTAYELLRVDPLAEPAIVSEAYEAMRKHYFRLVDAGAQPVELLHRLEEAHALISDPVRRCQYDARVSERRGAMEDRSLIERPAKRSADMSTPKSVGAGCRERGLTLSGAASLASVVIVGLGILAAAPPFRTFAAQTVGFGAHVVQKATAERGLVPEQPEAAPSASPTPTPAAASTPGDQPTPTFEPTPAVTPHPITTPTPAPPEPVTDTRPWPETEQWIPVSGTETGLCADPPGSDPPGDVSPAFADLVGSRPYPSQYATDDGVNLFLRSRLDGDPTSGEGFQGFRWGALIDYSNAVASNSVDSYEWLAIANGVSRSVQLIKNSSPVDPFLPYAEADEIASDAPTAEFPLDTHGRVVSQPVADPALDGGNDGQDYFLDIQIPLDQVGVPRGTPLRLVFFTSSSGAAIDSDINDTCGSLGNLLSETMALVVGSSSIELPTATPAPPPAPAPASPQAPGTGSAPSAPGVSRRNEPDAA